MKKLVLTIVAMAFGSSGLLHAQNSSKVEELYSRYSASEGVLAMNVNHKILDAIDLDFDWKDQMKNITGDIHKAKLIAFSEESHPLKKLNLLNRELAVTGLELIELPDDAEVDKLKLFRIYGQKTGAYYENVYLLIVTEDARHGAFVAINGKLKINKAS